VQPPEEELDAVLIEERIHGSGSLSSETKTARRRPLPPKQDENVAAEWRGPEGNPGGWVCSPNRKRAIASRDPRPWSYRYDDAVMPRLLRLQVFQTTVAAIVVARCG
jgi:hypothetical protein